MRETLLSVVLFVLAALLRPSCIECPEEPREFKPFRLEQYELILLDEPGLPRSFVGYGKPAMKPLAFKGAVGIWSMREKT